MVRLAVAGAGNRGASYARLAAATGRCRITAVAEPDPVRRARFAAGHDLSADRVFTGWQELAAAGDVADAVIVATQDRMHEQPAIAFLDRGWDVLLEKPMAPDEAAARRITEAAGRSGRIFAVCHVLRYTPYTAAITGVVGSGVLGELVSVQHLEPVGWWHAAHSFVRGNWRSEAGSGPMLLTKSCHDIDWLMHVVGEPVVAVSSFGALTHFRPEKQPAGAADRCLDCAVEPDCPYSAVRLYLGCLGDPKKERWPLGAVVEEPSEAAVRHALRTGDYGRCVYRCDNDVVDHQVVNLQFASGATATFSMVAFTPGDGHRRTRIFGSHGSLEGDGVTLTLTDFRDGSRRVVPIGGAGGTAADGHGGGDEGLITAFVAAVAARDQSLLGSDARAGLDSHRVVWAAERARRDGTVVRL